MGQTDVSGLSATKRALLEQRLRGASPSPVVTPPARRRVTHGGAPLSPEQEQIWYFSQLAPGNPAYNEAVSFRKDGPFDENAFRRAVNEIVRRHEIWRSTFSLVDGEPVQIVHDAPTYELPLVDLSRMPRLRAEREATLMAADSAMQPYILDRGPLLRPLLVRFAADHHRLYLALHHLIFDGVTLYRVVLPELIALYDAFAAGLQSPLSDDVAQFADYAAWERAWVEGSTFRQRLDYWERRLHEAPMLRLPLDHPRPARQRFRGGMVPIDICVEAAERLRAVCRQPGATLFQLLAAAFAVQMQRYTGQDDIVFATVADQRKRTEFQSMVGYCQTPLVLRADLSGDPSFTDLLGRLRSEVLGALDNQVPFDRLVRALRIPRDGAVNPVYQAMIVLEAPMNVPDPSWSVHMEVAVGNAVGNAKVDLHLEVDERPEGHISGRLIYNSDLFEPDSARRMAGHWHTLLEAVAADPSRRLSELPVLTDGERRQLIEWNATDADYPRHASVSELVAEQARRTDDRIAVVTDGGRLTFGQLDRRANALAHRLRGAGVHTGGVVSICADRSLDLIVGLLAILKSGAAYLPLDPRDPPSRLAHMLIDSGAEAVLVQPDLLTSLPEHRPCVVPLDPVGAYTDEERPDPPQSAVSADDLAYVIYTSGSTGRPKGVQVRHLGVVNLLTSMAREPGLRAADTVLAITPCSFDVSVVDLFLPLVTGARLVIASSEVAADGRRLGRLITECGATFMQATPSTWQMLRDTAWDGCADLVALSGGETLTAQLASWLAERTAGVWNGYGPTEATVYATLAHIEPGAAVTIGKPIANTRVYILDDKHQPVPVGVTGQMFIAGAGVARGYVNRPELTAERFVPDNFGAGPFMYASGDLGRRLPDGRIEHVGRLDDQVKLRGFRIEPGEIEAALVCVPHVGSAAVVAREQTPGDVRLVAYIVPDGDPPSAQQLRTALRAILPEYMVPSAFVVLEALPLSANGKVDRGAFPAPGHGAERGGIRGTPPRTELEMRLERIWARTLGVDRVGVDDDFFDSGGHSLLAVRLLMAVQAQLGADVPLASFFEGDVTVAALARIIETSWTGNPTGGTFGVAINANGSRPILFFVHADESSMLTLRHFTAPLGPDQPVLGLLPERLGRRFDRSRTIEDLAEPMLAAVRQAQPHGPYLLAGYSLGGLLAYELAGRLESAGEHVAWLGVLDAAAPAANTRFLQHRLSVGQRLTRQRQRGTRGALRKTGEVMRRELRATFVRVPLLRSRIRHDFDWRGANRLATQYVCKGNEATMDLFVTEDRVVGAASGSLGWADVHKGPLRVHLLDGDHLSMVTVPQVTTLAETVNRCLEDALQTAPATWQ